MPDAEWCWSHHPDYQEARRRRASKGGRRGGRGRPQAELQDIKHRLSELASDVLDGKQDRGRAAVASQVLNVYLRAIGMELKLREVEELAHEVEELRSLVEAKKEDNRWGYGTN
jgi:hypothetical protein